MNGYSTGAEAWSGSARAVLFICLFAACGCSGRIKTYPVSGKVKFADGQPVSVGIVELHSAEHQLTAHGKVGPNGEFKLGTYRLEDGAPAGEYRIVVVQYFGSDSQNAKSQSPPDLGLEHAAHASGERGVPVVDSKYASYATSGLRANVQPRNDNYIEIIVERAPAPRRPQPSR
jgi:hypothetical protein